MTGQRFVKAEDDYEIGSPLIIKNPGETNAPLTEEQARERLAETLNARLSFMSFMRYMHPTWVFPEYQKRLIEVLSLLEARELRHNFDPMGGTPQLRNQGELVYSLLVTMPPRHSKSHICTTNFPSWYMGRDPSRFTLVASYNEMLASDFGKKIKGVVDSVEFANVFPNFQMRSDARAANVWYTTDKGALYSTGLLGTTSGRASNLLIIDDPFRNRKDANSPATRKEVWDTFVSSLSSRREPEVTGNKPALRIVIMTMWHPDDLAGRIRETKEWRDNGWFHFNAPALVQLGASDSEEPKDWDALWPERFSSRELLKTKSLDEYEFAALYQQDPYTRGGGLIKVKGFQYSASMPDTWRALIITIDPAYTKQDWNDPSALMVAGLSDIGDIWILEIRKGHMEFPELKRAVRALVVKYQKRGLRGVYVEAKASGLSLIQELRKESGLIMLPVKAVADKVARMTPYTDYIDAGRVFLPPLAREGWVDSFVTECEQFPGGKEDDQVDCFSMAMNVLSRQIIPPEELSHGVNGMALSEQGASVPTAPGVDVTPGHRPLAAVGSLNSSRGRANWSGWGT